ncbi:MAG: hypothetical protein KDB14_11670 [Planctomycetales bacterium]|nr:hypothetical protein [Planctomycetales bacterium]
MNVLRNYPYWPVVAVLGALAFGFGIFVWALGGRQWLLDTSLTQQGASKTIGEMSPRQRNLHFWMTLTLDSLFPITYGLLLAQFAAKSGCSGWWLALPAIAVACDYTENAAHLIALRKQDAVHAIKSLVSPAKFAAIILSIAASVITRFG